MTESVTVKQYRITWRNGNGKPKYRYYRCPVVTGSNVGGLLQNGVQEMTVSVLEPKKEEK